MSRQKTGIETGIERVTTSIKVNPNFWKDVKIYCLKNDVEVSEFVEKTLKKVIQKDS